MTANPATSEVGVDCRFAEFARTREPTLRDDLIAEYFGLAHQIARRFCNRGEPQDDLVQVASLALVKAFDRFDPNRGVKFSTFAVTYMVGELKRHFRDLGWAVRVPRKMQELYLEIGHHVGRLSQELGRSPTVPELANALGVTGDAVLEAMEAGRAYRTSSIDAPDRDSRALSESLGSDDFRFAHIDDQSVLSLAMDQLPSRDQLMIRLRFIDGLTQSEIAAKFGVSQMQVSRLLTANIQRLRASFAEEHDLAV